MSPRLRSVLAFLVLGITPGCGEGAPDDAPTMDAGPPDCRPESCDGEDEDCDGRVDEALGGGDLCVPVPALIEIASQNGCALTSPQAQLVEQGLARGVDYLADGPSDPVLDIRDQDMGGGVVVADLSGDGAPDILFTAPWGTNALYLNDGMGMFTAVMGSVFESVSETQAVSAVDLDGDGLREVFLLTRSAVRVFENEGGGVFSEVAPLLVLAPSERASFMAWADFDGDGNVDVYLGRALSCFRSGADYCRSADRVYRGLGGGAFEDVSDRFGGATDRQGVAMAGAWVDVDRDGDLDFALINDVGTWHTPNRVFRNPGNWDADWRFDEVSAEFRLDLEMDGMGLAFGDLAGDGRLRFAISDVGHVRHVFNVPDGGFDRTLVYLEETAAIVPGIYPASWAVEAVDLDWSGTEELVVAWHWLYPSDWWAMGAPLAQLPMLAPPLGNTLHSPGDGAYSEWMGMLDDQPTSWMWHTVAPVDLNRDGAMDLVFGSVVGPSSVQMGACIEGRHFLAVALDQPGTSGNRDALGAKVEITTSVGMQWRRIGVGSTGCLSAKEPEAHFGLGEATSAELRVIWPDGRSSELGVVDADQRLRVIRQPEP